MLGSRRTADEIVTEIASVVAGRRTFRFAFAEHGVASKSPQVFRRVLEQLAVRMLPAKFYALGNITPAEVVLNPDLPKLMKVAGFVQVNLADDRDCEAEQFLEDCQTTAALLDGAGFTRGTDMLTAGVSIGRADENLDERVALATKLAHAVGSVLMWPYQPAPIECPGVSLHLQNSKLFPLREATGHTYRQYLDVLALGAVLNAKYREHGFDFLGDSRIPRLVRTSLRASTWEPTADEKGTIHLPVLARP